MQKTMTVAELKQNLANNTGELLLIDVREDEEVAVGMIPHAVHIPLANLEAKAPTLDTRRKIICYCRSGMRSQKATQILAAHGIEAANLTGGILAWQGETV